jgi:hypothetical protein
MAGLEPARAFYGPTDFKSVASAISPHRRFLHIVYAVGMEKKQEPGLQAKNYI